MSSGFPTPEALDECYRVAKKCLESIWFASVVCGPEYGTGGFISYARLAEQYDEARGNLINASYAANATISLEDDQYIAMANGTSGVRYSLQQSSSFDEDNEFQTIHSAVCDLARRMGSFLRDACLYAEDFNADSYILPTGTKIPAEQHRVGLVEEFSQYFPGWNCDISERLTQEYLKAQLVLRSGNVPSMVQHEIEALTGEVQHLAMETAREKPVVRADNGPSSTSQREKFSQNGDVRRGNVNRQTIEFWKHSFARREAR